MVTWLWDANPAVGNRNNAQSSAVLSPKAPRSKTIAEVEISVQHRTDWFLGVNGNIVDAFIRPK